MITPRTRARRMATLKEQNPPADAVRTPSKSPARPPTRDAAILDFTKRVAKMQGDWRKLQANFQTFLADHKVPPAVVDVSKTEILECLARLTKLVRQTPSLDAIYELHEVAGRPASRRGRPTAEEVAYAGSLMILGALRLLDGDPLGAVRLFTNPAIRSLLPLKLRFFSLFLVLEQREFAMFDAIRELCEECTTASESYARWLEAMILCRKAYEKYDRRHYEEALRVFDRLEETCGRPSFSSLAAKLTCRLVLEHAVKQPHAPVDKIGDPLFHLCRSAMYMNGMVAGKFPLLIKETGELELLDGKEPLDIVENVFYFHLYHSTMLRLIDELFDAGLTLDADTRLLVLLRYTLSTATPFRLTAVINRMALLHASVDVGPKASDQIAKWMDALKPLNNLRSMGEEWTFFETIEGDVYLNGYKDFLNETVVPRVAAERTAIFANLELSAEREKGLHELPPDSAARFYRLLAFHHARMEGTVGFRLTKDFEAALKRADTRALGQRLVVGHFRRMKSPLKPPPAKKKGGEEAKKSSDHDAVYMEAYHEFKAYQHLFYSQWRTRTCLFLATRTLEGYRSMSGGFRIELYFAESMITGLRAAIRRQNHELLFDASRKRGNRPADASDTVTLRLQQASSRLKQLNLDEGTETIGTSTTTAAPSGTNASTIPMLGYFPTTDAFQKCIRDLPADFTIVQLALKDGVLYLTRIHRDHEPFAVRLGPIDVEVFDSAAGSRDEHGLPLPEEPEPASDDRPAASTATTEKSLGGRLAEILRENERTATMKIAATEYWDQRYKLNSQLEKLVEKMQAEFFGDAWPLCLPFFPHAHRDEGFQRNQKNLRKSNFSVHTSCILSHLVDHLGEEDWVKTFKYMVGQDPALSMPAWTTALETGVTRKYRAFKDELKATEGTRKTGDRYVFLVVPPALSHVPWEVFPVFKKSMVSRIPSVFMLHVLLQKYEVVPRSVNSSSAYCVLNPAGNLAATQQRLEKLVARMRWEGVCGQIPNKQAILEALTSKDMYVYLGHGSGRKYIGSASEMRRIICQSVCLLMGCSSVEIRNEKFGYDGRSAIYDFISASCPCLIGCLWMATDGELDRFFIAFVEFCFEELVKAEVDQKDGIKKKRKVPIDPDEPVDAYRFMMRGIARARSACKLPFLTGGTVISYGLPTIAADGKQKKSAASSRSNSEGRKTPTISRADVLFTPTKKLNPFEEVCRQASARKKKP